MGHWGPLGAAPAQTLCWPKLALCCSRTTSVLPTSPIATPPHTPHPTTTAPAPQVVHFAVWLALYHAVLCHAGAQAAQQAVRSQQQQVHVVLAADGVQLDGVCLGQLLGGGGRGMERRGRAGCGAGSQPARPASSHGAAPPPSPRDPCCSAAGPHDAMCIQHPGSQPLHSPVWLGPE